MIFGRIYESCFLENKHNLRNDRPQEEQMHCKRKMLRIKCSETGCMQYMHDRATEHT